MRKIDKDYRSFIIATSKPNDHLRGISRLGGRIYSKTVSLTQKTHDKKAFWLSDSGLKKYLKFKGYPCHAHSVQAIIDDYCGARRSFFSNRKSHRNATPRSSASGIIRSHGVRWVFLTNVENFGCLWVKVERQCPSRLISSSTRKCQPKSP